MSHATVTGICARFRGALLASVSLSTVLGIAAVTGLVIERASSSPLDDGIVALVNGEPLTVAALLRVQADLVARFATAADQARATTEQLAPRAMRELVQRTLLLQEAARRKLTVGSAEFDAAIVELRSRFADLESLSEWMQTRRLGERELLETLREDLLIAQVNDALVEAAPAPTEEQLRAYFEAHRRAFIVREDVRLGIIAVDSPAAANTIMNRLHAGESFAALARTQANPGLAASSGDTGWVDLALLPAPIKAAVRPLTDGQAVGPIEKASDEFLVVALADRRVIPAEALDQVRPDLERRFRIEQARRTVSDWLAAAEARSSVEIYR